MKLKQLESTLQAVKAFENPVVRWEQYPTSPHIASHMLYTIDTVYDEVEGKVVGDLGCGCGMLGIAASLVGSSQVIGVDIDPNALSKAQHNCEELEEQIEFLIADMEMFNIKHPFDIVVMNPPFGTRNKGLDMLFLEKALQMSSIAVYSLHKTSTREHIQRKAKEWGVGMDVIAQLRWDIPNMYAFHKKKSVDIEVDFIRFEAKPVK